MPLTPKQYAEIERTKKYWSVPEDHPNYITPQEIDVIAKMIGVQCPMRPVDIVNGGLAFYVSPPKKPEVTFSDCEDKVIEQLSKLGIIHIFKNKNDPEPKVYWRSGTEYYYECDNKYIRIRVCRGEIKSFVIIIKKPSTQGVSEDIS